MLLEVLFDKNCSLALNIHRVSQKSCKRRCKDDSEDEFCHNYDQIEPNVSEMHLENSDSQPFWSF